MNLYYLSEENLHGQLLEPIIPQNKMVQKGYENFTLGRISVYPTIEQAIMSLPDKCPGKVFFVHVPLHINIDNCYLPDIDECPTCDLTGEHWLLNPTKMRCEGKITLGKQVELCEYLYGHHSDNLTKWTHTLLEKVDHNTFTLLNSIYGIDCWKDEDDDYYVRVTDRYSSLLVQGNYTKEELTKKFGKELTKLIVDSADNETPIHTNDILDIVEKEYVNHNSPEEILETAKEVFGTTSNPEKAFYLNSDGTYLAFYGRYRQTDHREISNVLMDYSGSEAMYKYMSMGHIRLQPEAPGMEIMCKPTEEQYSQIKKYVQHYLYKDGEFYLEIVNQSGYYQLEKDYNEMNDPYEVISDIEDYFDLNEGIHFGDLNKAKKGEPRGQMEYTRGTGHFGTGFYFLSDRVGKSSTYQNRDKWYIDESKYNLYKPYSTREAYRLHDALKKLNQLYRLNKRVPDSLRGKNNIDLKYEYDDMAWKGEEPNYMIEFLQKYRPDLLNHYTVKEYLEEKAYGALEDFVMYHTVELIEEYSDLQHDALFELDLCFLRVGEDKIKEIVDSLLTEPEEWDADSISTLFMKKLGYEGIQVSHLGDENGLRSPDNFGYGSVIYDLKPGTYHKVEE